MVLDSAHKSGRHNGREKEVTLITIKTLVETTYEVPNGVPIERIQQLALSELDSSEELMNEIQILHGCSLSECFLGDQEFHRSSISHSVSESD